MLSTTSDSSLRVALLDHQESKSANDSTSPKDSSCVTSKEHLPKSGSSPNSTSIGPLQELSISNFKLSLPVSKRNLTGYLEALGSGRAQCRRLVPVLIALQEAKRLLSDSYDRLWNAKGKIFKLSEHARRGRRLQEGRLRIEKNSIENDCAGRLGLMFMAHNVDHLLSALTTYSLIAAVAERRLLLKSMLRSQVDVKRSTRRLQELHKLLYVSSKRRSWYIA